jgi:hypothetical protein
MAWMGQALRSSHQGVAPSNVELLCTAEECVCVAWDTTMMLPTAAAAARVLAASKRLRGVRALAVLQCVCVCVGGG